MKNNNTLNIDVLTPSRQTLVTNALASHRLDMAGGKFTAISMESLSKIGLTTTEITAIEKNNLTSTAQVSLEIIENPAPSSENNPFNQEKWNPEKQRHLHDTNPRLAKNLMSEAGLLN